MKNSPHHQKHLQKKSLREARQIELNPQPQSPHPTSQKNPLNPLNVSRCKEVLNVYKKHLEKARFNKGSKHHSKRTTPGEVETLSHAAMNLRNPKRVSIHWQSSDLERSRRIAKKMLKQPYKKAA